MAKPYLVKDINPGSSDSTSTPNYDSNSSQQLININGTLYFAANDGIHGDEVWKSDGTKAGTVLLKDIYPGNHFGFDYHFTNVNGILYFTAEDGTVNNKLWQSDGTEAGTVLVGNFDYNALSEYDFGSLTNVNGNLYFAAYNVSRMVQLWESDGTQQGTVLVKDFRLDNRYSGIDSLINANGTIYFSIYTIENEEGDFIYKLWKSDGTEAGTVIVKDINPPLGFASNNSVLPTNIGNIIYFNAYDDTLGYELWKSDGTEEGTVLVKDINAGSRASVPSFNSDLYISQPELTNVNGILYFTADDGIHGGELWASDGTTENTVLVKDNIPGADGFYPSELTNVDGILYFSADDNIHGRELWALNTNPTVINNTVSIKATDANAVEVGNSPANFRISRIGDTSIALAVNYSLGGTATNGIDYTQLTGIAAFAVGQSFADITIAPVDDGLVEDSETVTLTLASGIAYDLDTYNTFATATISDSINIINGNDSRDPLTGTDGNDRIIGGTGSKTITGSVGDDQFIYTSLREVGHRITDFTVGSDKIVLAELLDSLVTGGYNGSDAFTDGYVRVVQGSNTNSTVVQIDSDGLMGSAVFRPFIQLDNVTPQAINNTSNFIF